MGVQERRERERASVRAAILDAARRISERDGWAGLTIRAIAADIEYSPALIYGYFKSKDAVLMELMRLGFGALLKVLQDARGSDADPALAVERIGLTYWKFALDSPVPYQLMLGLTGVPFGTDQTPAEARACFVEFHEPIAALLEDRGGKPGTGESEEQAELYWAFLHGLVSLTLNKRIQGGLTRANPLAERLVRDFVRGCQPETVTSKLPERSTE